MRQRLVGLLEDDERDVFAEAALRGFWSLGMPLQAAHAPKRPAETRVIDLAGWARARHEAART
jgi:hypothetical protein